MIYKSHRHLLGAVSVAAMLLPGYALAQDAQLQRQLDQLQSQVQSLQKQVADQKKREAAEAQASASGAYAASMPLKTKAPPLSPIKMTWGGFLAAESVYRQHNTVSDMGTPFTSIPYPFSPQYSEHEYRGSARASRLSLLVEGTIDPMQKLSGYYEMDFLGTGITSNYNQSNSWDMRLRQTISTFSELLLGSGEGSPSRKPSQEQRSPSSVTRFGATCFMPIRRSWEKELRSTPSPMR